MGPLLISRTGTYNKRDVICSKDFYTQTASSLYASVFRALNEGQIS